MVESKTTTIFSYLKQFTRCLHDIKSEISKSADKKRLIIILLYQLEFTDNYQNVPISEHRHGNDTDPVESSRPSEPLRARSYDLS